MSSAGSTEARGTAGSLGPAVVAARDLAVAYPGESGAALMGVTFAIGAGEAVALLGANGSGKSTLLKAITGELPTHGGELSVRGPVAAVAQQEQLRRDVPITAVELATMGAYHRTPLLRRVAKADRALAREALGRVGLADEADKPVAELSGGQRQRALLARALVHGGSLLALDEPLAAIDPGSAQRIHTVLEEERAAGHTLLVATHDLAELHRWDRVLVLAGGCQLAFGPPSELPPDVLDQAYDTAHRHGPCEHEPPRPA
ncbi:MAG: metal ABC transporter ATP-binding protein [Solirubrobacteraceae bacterium]|nr:metal ABC transporter ATP-binding protein [Solirubrobacteraceae bacterium]